MMVAWLAVDLLNLAFYSAVHFGGVRGDSVIGPIVIMFMYATLLVELETKVFGLTNEVPTKVLGWIGGHQHPGVVDTREMLGGAKQGGEGAAKTGMEAVHSEAQKVGGGVRRVLQVGQRLWVRKRLRLRLMLGLVRHLVVVLQLLTLLVQQVKLRPGITRLVILRGLTSEGKGVKSRR